MWSSLSAVILMEISSQWLIYRDLAIVLAAGLLIGMERGWTMRDEQTGSRVAGIHTFSLIAGLGGLLALISQSLNLIIAASLLAGVVVMLSVSHFRTIHDPDGRSITNFVVSLLTLNFGLLAGSGYPALAMTVLANMIFKAAVASFTAGWQNGRSAVVALLLSSIILAIAGLVSFVALDIRF